MEYTLEIIILQIIVVDNILLRNIYKVNYAMVFILSSNVVKR